MMLRAGDTFWGHDPGHPDLGWSGEATALYGLNATSPGITATMATGKQAYFARHEIYLTKEDYCRALILEAAGVKAVVE